MNKQETQATWLIGGGFLGGIALALMTPQQWSRAGAAVFGSAAWVARSAVGPGLIVALAAHLLADHPATETPPQGMTQPPDSET